MSSIGALKFGHLWISAAALLIFGFLLSQDSLARTLWHKYGKAEMALVLVRHDATLAAELGNFFFAGTIGRKAYDLDRAQMAYEKALKLDPGIRIGHYQLARIHFVRGNFQQALTEINEELRIHPENLRSLYIRGLIYGYRNLPGDLANAEEDYRRFIQWAPSEWAGYNDLAWILLKSYKYRDVAPVIQQAFASAPGADKNPWLWNSLGVAQLNRGEFSDAAESFENAKREAEKLTLADWQRSYPGNDPTQATNGLAAFREAIEKNLVRATRVPPHSL